MEKIKQIIKKNLRLYNLLSKIVRVINLVRYPFYCLSIFIRSRMSIFSIYKLSSEILLDPKIIYFAENAIYGHNKLFKKLTILENKKIKYLIKHAYILGIFTRNATMTVILM